MDNQDEYLIHYGVLGMKWGVRRRLGNIPGVGRLVKSKTKTDNDDKDNKDDDNTPKKKSVKDMSDVELTTAIKRLENEKRYNDLTATSEGKKKVSRGKKLVEDMLEQSAKNIGTQTTTYIMGTAVNSIGKKFGIEQLVNPKKGQKDK